jgi:hypothetical protein
MEQAAPGTSAPYRSDEPTAGVGLAYDAGCLVGRPRLVPFIANGGFLSGDRLADEFSGISQTRPSTGAKP